VEAFDKLMNSMVAEFLKNSRILAGDVETHVSTPLPVLCRQSRMVSPALDNSSGLMRSYLLSFYFT
jgi:hypothetical protein